MRLFPKKHFKWKEPKSFLGRAEAFHRAEERWWHRPAAVVVVTAVLLATWGAAHANPNKHPPSFPVALGLGLSLGLFLTYAVPWIYSFFSPEITLFQRSAIRLHGSMHQAFRYEDLAGFEWRVHPDFAVLILHRKKAARPVLIGVPLEIDREAVTAFLAGQEVAPKPVD